jgi:ABC transporter/Periplasmic binding protein
VADANAAGGIKIGGTAHQVKLVVLNNQSDLTTAAQQVRDLVLKDGAQAVLGAGTPPITVPQALIAESLRVPYLTTNTPVGAFAAGSKGGWKYSCCGKTTLLRCIAGLTAPSEGRVTIAGREVTEPPEGVGMVFQQFGLSPWKTVAG